MGGGRQLISHFWLNVHFLISLLSSVFVYIILVTSSDDNTNRTDLVTTPKDHHHLFLITLKTAAFQTLCGKGSNAFLCCNTQSWYHIPARSFVPVPVYGLLNSFVYKGMMARPYKKLSQISKYVLVTDDQKPHLSITMEHWFSNQWLCRRAEPRTYKKRREDS